MWLLPFFKTLFKNLGNKPSTYAFPGAPMPKDALVRGHVEIDISGCIFCNICGRKCPTDALVINKETKVWKIAYYHCIVCGQCVEACPKKCLYMNPELTPPTNVKKKYRTVAAPQAQTDENVTSNA